MFWCEKRMLGRREKYNYMYVKIGSIIRDRIITHISLSTYLTNRGVK